jgi:hypothetical protein
MLKAMASIFKMAISDTNTLGIWEHIVLHSECCQLSILSSIIQELVKLRGHSIANMEMEKYKRKKANATKNGV